MLGKNGSRELVSNFINLIVTIVKQFQSIRGKRNYPLFPSVVIKISNYFFSTIFHYFIDKLKWNFSPSLYLTDQLNYFTNSRIREKWYASGRRKPIRTLFHREIRKFRILRRDIVRGWNVKWLEQFLVDEKSLSSDEINLSFIIFDRRPHLEISFCDNW